MSLSNARWSGFRCRNLVLGVVLLATTSAGWVFWKLTHPERVTARALTPKVAQELNLELVRIDDGARFLEYPSVQRELQLTPEQTAKALKLVAELRAHELRLVGQALGTASSSSRNQLPDRAFLNAWQQQRLNQIDYQLAGLAAFSRPEIAARLRLTQDQNEKIRALEQQLEVAASFRNDAGKSRGASTRGQSLVNRKEYATKALQVLNEEQRTAWRELTGRPFDVKR